MKDLEGWILQMDDYFTITQTRNEVQRLAYVGLCTEGEALEWWKSNNHWFNPWREVVDAIKEYYGDHYKLERALTRSVIASKQELCRNTLTISIHSMSMPT